MQWRDLKILPIADLPGPHRARPCYTPRMPTEHITRVLQEAGGEVFIVGGAVRDELLGIESKDIDFLVRLLDFDAIKRAVSPIGKVFDQEVGGKVSMVKAVVDGVEFDITIPRTQEIKTGDHHTDFDIVLDPHAPIEDDFARRDFTINALARDMDGNIVDSFGGVEDLRNRVIRAVGNPEERFQEDPLRMLRALQFAARLGFNIEPNTTRAIETQSHLLKTVASERIAMEMDKAWTKGRADVDLLIRMLKDFRLGTMLFGEDFNPLSIKIQGSHEDKVTGTFVAFFLRGGNEAVMCPTNKMQEHLITAKLALVDEPKIWKWAKKDHLPLLIQVFEQIGLIDIVARMERATQLPMLPKELAIGGREFMELGLRGKQIGEAQQDALSAIFEGELENDRSALIDWMKSRV